MKATIDLYTIATFWILWLLSYSLHETLVRLDGNGTWIILGQLAESGFSIAASLTSYLIAATLFNSLKGNRDEAI